MTALIAHKPKNIAFNKSNKPGNLLVSNAIGLNSFSLTLTNNNVAGNISAVNIYGSADGVNYYDQELDVFPAGIAAGDTGYYQFSSVSAYLKVTAEGPGVVGVYLVGNVGGGSSGASPGPGGGSVDSVTGTAPIYVDSSDPANPDVYMKWSVVGGIDGYYGVGDSPVAASLWQTICVDPGGGPMIIDLPAIAAGNKGGQIKVKNVNSSINNVVVNPNGGDTIDGAPDYTMNVAREWVILESNGISDWMVVG